MRWRRQRLALAGIADQGLSSGTNVLTSLIAARLLTPAEFGAVVIALSIGFVALTAQRALGGDTLLAYGPTVPIGERAQVTRDALALATMLGLLAAGACAAIGSAPWRLTVDVGWMAIWLPALLVQDAYRYAFFTVRRPDLALGTDIAWASAQAVALVVAILGGWVTGPVLLAAWGMGGLVGALVAAGLSRVSPVAGRPLRWLRRTRHLSGWFAAQMLVAQSTSQVLVFVIGGVLGGAALGGFRAAYMLFLVPVQSLLLAGQSLLIPVLAGRAAAGDYARIQRDVRRMTGWSVCLVTVLAGAAVAARGPLLEAVFTVRFREFADLVPATAVATICCAATTPCTAASRALHNARGIFLVQAVVTAASIPAVWVGATRWGIQGCAWAIALTSLVTLIAAVRTYHDALAAERRRVAAASATHAATVTGPDQDHPVQHRRG
jgi:O-antigen/teichoic acid export membrane protein